MYIYIYIYIYAYVCICIYIHTYIMGASINVVHARHGFEYCASL